jgi:large subunit ribosomal protein L7/L12
MLMGGGGGDNSGNTSNSGSSDKGETKAVEKPKEKEVFDIKLTAVDAKSKIKIIKEIRVITGLGLKEAKEMVEKAPIVVKTGAKKDEAEAIKKILVDNGATVDIL